MVPIKHKVKMFRQCFLNGIYAFTVMNKMFDRYSELDTELGIRSIRISQATVELPNI